MNPIVKAFVAGAAPVLNAVRRMRHGGQPLFLNGLLKRSRFDYRAAIGDGLDSSVVTAPIMWIHRALPEARLAMRETKSDGSIEELDNHEMLELIQNPNDFYSDIALWAGTLLSYLLAGNAYWIKVRNNANRVTALWWVPHWMMKPVAPTDGSEFISHYEYTPATGLGRMYLDPADVVHFRHGINPSDQRRGLSPLDGVIREIFIDLESSNFIASLLRNFGVPSVIISPKGGGMPVPEDVEATKTWFKQAFGGDNRGGPMVMGAPTDVSSFGFNPQQMNLSYGSDRAEERVCACLGIPAAVVGFGAGLQQTKVGATMGELRKLAWHNGVLPIGRQLVDELKRSLLPDFQRPRERTRRIELYWNTDDVLALQEDENKQIERKLKELQGGAITLFDYLSETGRDADDSHKVYLRPLNQIVVPADELAQVVEGRRLPAAVTSNTDDPPDDDGGTKTLPEPETKHSEDWLPTDREAANEEQIERGDRFVTRLERAENGISEGFEQRLRPVFEGWGDEAGRIGQNVLEGNGEKAGRLIETKAPDDQLVREIIDLLNFEAWEAQLSSRYQSEYLAIARDVAEAIEESGYGTMLPDARMREVIEAGGKRAGLVDLSEQTRAALFKALAEGRAEGEGVTALANRIANQVEGGPFKDASTRAKLIARIETKHAQNISTLENARANGFSRFIVYDGRLGPGRSEPSHIARNGWIVGYEDAMTMTVNMRPNCTLSFAPHFEL
ncbi:MAG: phage portal protein [Pseudomonadota bacterium]